MKRDTVDYNHLPLIHALPTIELTGFLRNASFSTFLRILEPHKPLDVLVTVQYMEKPDVRAGFVNDHAYAVFATCEEAELAVAHVNAFHGRSAIGKAAMSDYDNILKTLFPSLFQVSNNPQGSFVTKEGLDKLEEICAAPAKWYNNAHPERPFETFISVLHHFPWHMVFPLLPVDMIPIESELYTSLCLQVALLKQTAPKLLDLCYQHSSPVNSRRNSRCQWHRINDRLSKRLLKAILAIPAWTLQEQHDLLTNGKWDPSYRSWCVDFDALITSGGLAKMVDEWSDENVVQLRGYCGQLTRQPPEKFIMNQEMPWLISNVKRVWNFAHAVQSMQSTPETMMQPSNDNTPERTPLLTAPPLSEKFGKFVHLPKEAELANAESLAKDALAEQGLVNGLPIVSAFPPFRPIGFTGSEFMPDSRTLLRNALYQCLGAAHQLSRSPLGPSQLEHESLALEEVRRNGGDDLLMLANMLLGHLVVAHGKDAVAEKDPSVVSAKPAKSSHP